MACDLPKLKRKENHEETGGFFFFSLFPTFLFFLARQTLMDMHFRHFSMTLASEYARLDYIQVQKNYIWEREFIKFKCLGPKIKGPLVNGNLKNSYLGASKKSPRQVRCQRLVGSDKNQGNIQNSTNYCRTKIMSQTMKVWRNQWRKDLEKRPRYLKSIRFHAKNQIWKLFSHLEN